MSLKLTRSNNNALHRKDDKDRLYGSRKEGRRKRRDIDMTTRILFKKRTKKDKLQRPETTQIAQVSKALLTSTRILRRVLGT